MSDELKRGIPKANPTGKAKQYSEEEKKQHDLSFEKILKEAGVLKENQTIQDLKHPKK